MVKLQRRILVFPEYLIRQARELKKNHSILRKNRGKPLPASTTEKVQFFYEDDAHSRLMPGRKDFVTIKKNVHKQKKISSMQPS